MQILSYDEAAKWIGLVRRSLERLISRGQGPAVIHISTRRRGIAESDFEQWAMSRRKQPPGEDKSGRTASDKMKSSGTFSDAGAKTFSLSVSSESVISRPRAKSHAKTPRLLKSLRRV